MAAVNKTKRIPVEHAFGGGLVDGQGRDKTPANCSVYLRNARIDNESCGPRLGFSSVIDTTLPDDSQGLIANLQRNDLIFISGGIVYLGDVSTGTYTAVIGNIGYTGIVGLFNFGKYTIICTGIDRPWVYDGTSLFQTTLTELAAGVNPQFGVAFQGFTVIAGNELNTSNILYISRPVTTNQAYCYDWNESGGTADSETVTYASPIDAVVNASNNMFVFTKATIEYIGKDSLTTIGGSPSLASIPVGTGEEVLNWRICVPNGDSVFYINNNKQVKTINYVQGTVDPKIGELSDKPLLNIKSFMDNLNDDQSIAFGYKINTLICWHLRTKNSLVNDVILIYDLVAKVFLVDNNKYYNYMTEINSKYYASSSLGTYIFQDNVGYDDDGDPTPFEYATPYLGFGQPNILKGFDGFEIAGEMNIVTVLTIDVLVDGNFVNSLTIRGIDVASDYGVSLDEGIGAYEIGGASIGGSQEGGNLTLNDMFFYQKTADEGEVFNDGNRLQLIFKCAVPGAIFYMDMLAFFVTPTGSYNLQDKL